MEIFIAKGKNAKTLTEDINQGFVKGYSLIGETFYNNSNEFMYQKMIKYDPEDVPIETLSPKLSLRK